MKEKIKQIIADALYLELEEVQTHSLITLDLGAESIDFLDIVFRLEKEFDLKIPRGTIERQARGPLSEDEFADQNGRISSRGRSELKKYLAETPSSMFKQDLNVRDIPNLLTVQTFINLVEDQKGLRQGGAAHGLQQASSTT